MDQTFAFVLSLAMALAIGFAVFFLTRVFWLWYWKIDERIALAKDLNSLLFDIRSELRSGGIARPGGTPLFRTVDAPDLPPSAGPVPTPIETRADGKMLCPQCKRFVTPVDHSDGKRCRDDWTLLAAK